jgi:hypothetical protein
LTLKTSSGRSTHLVTWRSRSCRSTPTSARNSVEQVDLLKVDVEGGESAVLRGAAGFLSGPNAPAVMIEINPAALASSGSSPAEVYGLLTDRGYCGFVLARHNGYANILAVKPPRPAPAGIARV